MIKVGYLTKKRDACHWLRVLNPMSLLNANGHQANDELLEQQLYCMKCRKGPYETQYTEKEEDKVCPDCSNVMMSRQDFVNWKLRVFRLVRDHDIICFQRPTHPAHVTMMRESKAVGKKVVQICDDDYINIPEFNTGYKYYTARRQVIIESLQESDAIDVTTPYLKNLYSRFCENVEILPNCLDLAMVDACMPIDGVKVYAGAGKEISWDRFAEVRKGKRLVLWGGSPTHEKDLEVVIPAIRRLSRDENLLFAFVGYVHRAILEDVPEGRLFLFGLVSNTQYFPLYKKIAPEIGIAPVCEIPFNQGKSGLKSIEYQAILALPVVSDWVTYKNSTPAGIYAENTPRGWYNALSKAASMSDEDLKSRTIENRKFIEDNYDISTKWQLWVKFYEKVLAL